MFNPTDDDGSIDSLSLMEESNKMINTVRYRPSRPAPRPLPQSGSLTLPDTNHSNIQMKIIDYGQNKENEPWNPLSHHGDFTIIPHPSPIENQNYGIRSSDRNFNNSVVPPMNSMSIDQLQTAPHPHSFIFPGNPNIEQDCQQPTYYSPHCQFPTNRANILHQPLRSSRQIEYLSIPGVNQTTKEKLQQHYLLHQEQKHAEQELKYQVEVGKEALIEHHVVAEERLRQELMDQQKRYEHLLAEKDHSHSLIINEKERQFQQLKKSLEQLQADNKENLLKKDESYISQIKKIETKFQEQIQQLLQSHHEQLYKIQDQLKKDQEFKAITDRARLEAKEKDVASKYEKKIKKYGTKVEEIIENFRVKELKITGALEEARREIVHLQANFEAKEQSFREELILKDRRLIQIQQRLDSVDDLAKVAETWRETAKDLASTVIRMCATVEDLPHELWSSTTPGLFTTVWDDLQHLKASHNSSTTGKLPRNEDIAETYAKKRKEYVMASRMLLSKCLRFSKVSYSIQQDK